MDGRAGGAAEGQVASLGGELRKRELGLEEEMGGNWGQQQRS